MAIKYVAFALLLGMFALSGCAASVSVGEPHAYYYHHYYRD
jgi:hypothetical protein